VPKACRQPLLCSRQRPTGVIFATTGYRRQRGCPGDHPDRDGRQQIGPLGLAALPHSCPVTSFASSFTDFHYGRKRPVITEP
jgi:hypothetical protein